jgi:NTE family protein
MEAYAIFDGGGVKGAALVGALAAARSKDLEFLGYGGTSAGSISQPIKTGAGWADGRLVD